jgi:hypothetical protein
VCEVNGRLQCGYVTSYTNSMWTIKYVDRVPTSRGFHEHVLGEEKVGLSTLNTLVEIRCKDDFPGNTSVGVMWASDADKNAELVILLAGCTDECKTKFKDRKTPNWDTRHWMSNFGSKLSVSKGTPTHLFPILLSNALFTILPGEYHRVKHYLLSQRNLSSDEIKKMKRSFWRRHCRYTCQKPKVLLSHIYFMYQFFCSIKNPHRENGKVLVGNHRDVFYKEIKHVQHGLLSDPQGMIMYTEVPRRSKTGRKGNLILTRYRSLRTSSALKASLLHLHASIHPC